MDGNGRLAKSAIFLASRVTSQGVETVRRSPRVRAPISAYELTPFRLHLGETGADPPKRFRRSSSCSWPPLNRKSERLHENKVRPEIIANRGLRGARGRARAPRTILTSRNAGLTLTIACQLRRPLI